MKRWWMVAMLSLALSACGSDDEETGTAGGGETTEPEPEPLPDASPIAAGEDHTCAVRESGAVYCWGRNLDGELGDGTGQNRRTPVPVVGLTEAHLAVGGYHVCALRQTGAVSCFGKSGDGQLGAQEVADAYHAGDRIPSLADLTLSPSTVHTFDAAGPIQPTPMISAGDGFACGVSNHGRVLFRGGSNSSGMLGNGTAKSATSAATEVVGITDAVEVRTSQSSACARRASGEVACWGYLGRFNASPDHVRTSRPIPLVGVNDAEGLSLNSDGPCVLHRGGTVTCISHGDREPIAGLTGVAQIVAGGNTVCARLTEGGVRCWGAGSYGQLGNHADARSATPVEVAGITDATQITFGFFFGCALRSGGSVECWGRNQYGELGNGQSGETEHANSPVAVRGVRGAVEVSAGTHFACIRKADHGIQCWGANDFNQLGTGQDGDAVPEVIPLATSVAPAATNLGPITQIAGGWHHGCTLHESGQIQCWGRSSVLGEGTLGGLISSSSNVPRALTQVTLGGGPPPTAPAPVAAPTEAPPTEAVLEAPEEQRPATDEVAEVAAPHHRDHRAAVESAVHQASRGCYGRLGSHGSVTERVVVGPDGRVTTSQVVHNGTGNQETGRCISGALVRRRFTAPRQAAVTYDIVFAG